MYTKISTYLKITTKKRKEIIEFKIITLTSQPG